jgi:alkylhydroperoxidase family enzyme
VLLQNGVAPDALRAIAEGSADTGLTEAERAVMAYAEKVVRDATAVTPGDIDALRAHGLSDAEIFDIAAAAGACPRSAGCSDRRQADRALGRHYQPA